MAPRHTLYLTSRCGICRFPAKTALLMGREREGIPPDILGILDATVEILQHGIIRSLNVHVAASTAVYEYVRQHHKAAE